MSENDYMTLGEGADYLRVNRKTIYRMIDKRAIPTVKVGRQWRFSKNSVDSWLSQNSLDEVASILVIDDDDNICSFVRDALEPEGLDITAVTNPFEGLDLVKQKNFDLVFVDLKMPEMNGAELTRNIKEVNPDLPVIVITGYPDSDLMDEALKYGPIAVIRKPLTSANLFTAVNSYLHINIK